MKSERRRWLACFAVGAALGLTSFWLPAPAPSDAWPNLFSAARALEHIKAIAQAPHPSGSPENRRVREYLFARMRDLGLNPREISGEKGGAKVVSIYGQLEGINPGNPPILLVAHFDSTPRGPGAADDATGIATCLESVRALKARGKMRNSVGILLTDGEELPGMLLGAETFITKEAKLMNDLRVVVNMEARGNRGPVIMFQAGDGNNGRIRLFSRACPLPVAASFSEEVYRRMPNDTDFTVFLKAGKRGFNFAFVGGIEFYHTNQDTPENLNLRTLQHYGDCVLPLAAELGGADNEALDRCLNPGDATFFTLCRGLLIHYSSETARTLAFLTVAMFMLAFGYGVWHRTLRLKFVALSVGVCLVSITSAALLSAGALFLMLRIFKPQAFIPFIIGLPFDGLLLGVSVLASGGVTIFMRERLLGRANAFEALLAALIPWVGLAIVANATLPGASYLFVWPAFFGTLSLLVSLWRANAESFLQAIFSGMPASLILAPTILLMYQAITIGLVPLFGALTALAFTLCPRSIRSQPLALTPKKGSL